jgi:hypothetical protein
MKEKFKQAGGRMNRDVSIPKHLKETDFVKGWLDRLTGPSIVEGFPGLIDSTKTEDFQFSAKPITIMYNTIKSKLMKEKKFYQQFKVGEREVTLCILVYPTKNLQYLLTPNMDHVKIGYSVRVPEDKKIEGLSRKIALGRARKSPINGGSICNLYSEHNGVLKGIAYYWQDEFKRDLKKYVKGVK